MRRARYEYERYNHALDAQRAMLRDEPKMFTLALLRCERERRARYAKSDEDVMPRYDTRELICYATCLCAEKRRLSALLRDGVMPKRYDNARCCVKRRWRCRRHHCQPTMPTNDAMSPMTPTADARQDERRVGAARLRAAESDIGR